MPYSMTKRNQFLNLTFPGASTVSYNSPNKIYLGLSSNDPVADGGTFNELDCDTYSRLLIARRGQDLPDYLSTVAEGKIYNKKQMNFNRATEAWTRVMGIGIFEDETGGEPIFYANIQNEDGYVDVGMNQIFTFDPETFVVQFADTDVEIEATASTT